MTRVITNRAIVFRILFFTLQAKRFEIPGSRKRNIYRGNKKKKKKKKKKTGGKKKKIKFQVYICRGGENYNNFLK